MPGELGAVLRQPGQDAHNGRNFAPTPAPSRKAWARPPPIAAMFPAHLRRSPKTMSSTTAPRSPAQACRTVGVTPGSADVFTQPTAPTEPAVSLMSPSARDGREG